MSERRFTALGVGLGIAAGFLAGVLLIAILGGAEPVIKERTVQRTTTVEVPSGVEVPDLLGARLDEALSALEGAGLDADVEGGGLFGVVDEGNWEVTDQDPAGGARVEEGTTVTLLVRRS